MSQSEGKERISGVDGGLAVLVVVVLLWSPLVLVAKNYHYLT